MSVSPGAGLMAQMPPVFDGEPESAWIEVIRKMDEVYADLLRYEIDLETKNAELEQAQAFISSVIESVSDILIVCDHRGRVQQVNPAATRLLGHGAEDLTGLVLSALVAAEDLAQVDELLKARFPTDVVTTELRFVTATGLSDLLAINGSIRLDPHGHRVGTVLTGRPVGELRRAYQALHKAHSELQRAQRQLVEQEKMASLGRLVAGVAHELNNPISFVYGNIHVLERYRQRLTRYLTALHDGAEEADIAAMRRDLKIDAVLADCGSLIDGTLEGATRVSDIVKNLRRLSFSKVGEAGPVDVEQVISTATRWALRAKPIKVDMVLDIETGLTIHGNEGQVHQIIVNLIDNAIDALRGGTHPIIEITALRAADEAMIVIRDNGPGVSETALDKIFEPFFTTKPVGEGTGLGLWISYAIAREHGGSLTAANHPQGGAVFTLLVPATPS